MRVHHLFSYLSHTLTCLFPVLLLGGTCTDASPCHLFRLVGVPLERRLAHVLWVHATNQTTPHCCWWVLFAGIRKCIAIVTPICPLIHCVCGWVALVSTVWGDEWRVVQMAN